MNGSVTNACDTKTKILDLAEAFLQDKGFNAFSYHDIAAQLGIKNAAVHYHYPTKEKLGIDIIQRARTRFAALQQRAVQRNDDPWHQLDLFLGIYRNNLLRQQKVCLLGSLGTDYFTLPNPTQTEIRLLVNEMLDWLTAVLEAGRTSGHFTFRGEAAHKAMAFTTSLAGALPMARITDNAHYFAIEKQLLLELGNEQRTINRET